jgi:hypothetical protein
MLEPLLRSQVKKIETQIYNWSFVESNPLPRIAPTQNCNVATTKSKPTIEINWTEESATNTLINQIVLA